ncbi:MAG: GNAT family N-acetyltransferase [Chloroflexota bacterium]
MNPPGQIEIERLILRKPRRDDAPVIFAAWTQDPEVTRYLTWRPHKSVDESYAILDLIAKLWRDGEAFTYVITLKGDDRPIGMLAIHPDGFKPSLGYVLARPHWGKGYMTEAVRAVTDWLLRQPDIYRVFATCDVDNPASAKVMEKAGMKYEGLLRRYMVHPNISAEPRDCLMYAITKP